MTRSASAVVAEKSQKSDWWRTALGEYPTGVAIITGRDPETGTPVGLVVGSFSAVSDDPPIISFMATRASRTYELLRRGGEIGVSVLGAEHEQLCREFARDPGKRFQTGDWVETTNGCLRLADSVVWFGASIRQAVEAGDHDVVLADVSSFGVGAGEAGLPLIFLKGGYGSFAVPSLEFNPQAVGISVRQADAIRHAVDRVARELNVFCFIATVAKESVIVLSAANVSETEGASVIGQAFPFAAPLASVLAAWGSEERVKIWEENSRHLLGVVDRPHMRRMLDQVRERGHSVSVGESVGAAFDVIAGNPESRYADFSRLWLEMDREDRELADSDRPHEHVQAIAVPVFGADGHAEFELYLSGLGRGLSPERFEEIRRRAVQVAAELTASFGGRVPSDYPVPTPGA